MGSGCSLAVAVGVISWEVYELTVLRQMLHITQCIVDEIFVKVGSNTSPGVPRRHCIEMLRL